MLNFGGVREDGSTSTYEADDKREPSHDHNLSVERTVLTCGIVDAPALGAETGFDVNGVMTTRKRIIGIVENVSPELTNSIIAKISRMKSSYSPTHKKNLANVTNQSRLAVAQASPNIVVYILDRHL